MRGLIVLFLLAGCGPGLLVHERRAETPSTLERVGPLLVHVMPWGEGIDPRRREVPFTLELSPCDERHYNVVVEEASVVNGAAGKGLPLSRVDCPGAARIVYSARHARNAAGPPGTPAVLRLRVLVDGVRHDRDLVLPPGIGDFP